MRALPPVVLLVLLVLPALAVPCLADDAGPPSAAPRGEDAIPPQAELTGRQIYQCVLDNRFDSYIQESVLTSGDRGEESQESRLRMTWKSFRVKNDAPDGAVLSKSMVKYTEPFDLRFSGYLIVNNHLKPNDQFVYLASSRRIRRVNLRREAVFGTDFTFEDIVPREIEDGEYSRKPDKVIDGVPTYVVEVTPKDFTESEYSRFVIHVEKEHCVPLLTRYWDERELEVKKLTAPASGIRELDGIYWPMELTMTNLRLETFTTLKVENLEPNPDLKRRTFDLRRLESH